ncbi:SusC/RagA family TonB-linked outer membrane protein [Sphingobacterium sp. LRF_L2]|uniref:SusC/RagA family TonB-linked outer membrane protein n=1 Tax=Sphingobacterium sp. LRF_L2 TaxID=3369421 RepID=UPI003F616FDE
MNEHYLNKVIRILLISLFICLHTDYSNAQTITLKAKTKSIEEIINIIRQQTAYEVYILKDYLSDTHPVTVDVKKMPLSQFLQIITKGQPIEAKIEGKTVILTKRNSKSDITTTKQPNITEKSIAAQEGLIQGRVVDKDGAPISGASVEVSSNNNRTVVSDRNGNFQIVAHIGDVVAAHYIGYQPLKIAIIDLKQHLVMTLEQSINEMEDVVVTGIFEKKKETYTGAMTAISSEQIQANRGQNLLQTLKNIDPAFQIQINNELGSNPNNIPEVTLRGRSSLPTSVEEYNTGASTSVNTPLVIMDGFEISLTKLMDFNDEDIESINILKDASATAIYGSRGANGVIVIVRKKPKPGKLLITPRYDLTFELPDLNSYNLLNAKELLELQYRQGQYSGTSAATESSLKNTYNNRLKEVLEGLDTDWLHYPVRTGISQKQSLRVEGGSDQFVWGTNLAYNNVNGAMKGSNRKTFNGDITLAYNYKNVIFRNQLSVGLNKGTESPYGSFSTWVDMMPYYSPYDSNGNLLQYLPGFNEYTTDGANPLYDATLNNINQSKYTELINNFSLEWKISSPLRFFTRLGLSKKGTSSDVFIPANHSTFITYNTEDLYFRKGRYTYNTGDATGIEGQLNLSYSKTFAGVHQLYGGLDYFIQQKNAYDYGFIAEGFPADSKGFLGNALQYASEGSPSGSQSTTRSIGITANANYAYDNRYLADLSYRVDGSSQFGSQNRFAPFWSAGIGWNLHNENYIKLLKFINLLRIRGSYGETGAQQFSAYQAEQTYEYFTGDKYLNRSGVYLVALGNEDLKWQVTKQFNTGIEFGIFNNRVNGTFDYYVKNTSNLLSARDLPLSTGFASYIDNIGTVKNTGFELSLNVNIIRKNGDKPINWILGSKIAYNKNRITKLSDAIKAQTQAYMLQGTDVSTLFFEGFDQNSIWAVKSLGIDPSTGNELFLDKDGNITEEWDASAKVYAGVPNPKYNGNITSMLRYGNFTLNLNFGYHWGGQIYNQTLIDRVEVTEATLRTKNVDRRVLDDRWSKSGDQVFFKAFSDESTRATTRFVMDENVIELQSASIDYRIVDNPFLKKYKIQNMRFGLNMSDLFYISTVKRERGTSYPYARRAGFFLTFTL